MIRFVAEGRALELPLDTPAERVRVLSDIFLAVKIGFISVSLLT